MVNFLRWKMIWSVGDWSLWERFGGVAEIDQFPPILPQAFARFIRSGEISDRIWGLIWWYDNSKPESGPRKYTLAKGLWGLWRGSCCTRTYTMYSVQCTLYIVHCTMYIPLDVGHSKGWHLGHGHQDYRVQVKEFVNIGIIGNIGDQASILVLKHKHINEPH